MARPRVAAVRSVNQRTRFAIFFVFLVLLCLSLAWRLDASSTAAAAADCTTPSFGPRTLYAAPISRAIATDDFDGDGNPDLVIIDASDRGVLSLYLGDGTGAFPFRAVYSDGKGHSPRAIATGDFDGDGQPDIVIANRNSIDGNVSVYLNEGLFFDREIPLRWTSPGTSSSLFLLSVAVADFNGDGKPDVVMTNAEFNFVSVALGGAGGNFTDFKSFNSGGVSPVHVVARDFNGDGKIDLAVANVTSGGDNVAILPGDGAGNFGAPTAYAVGSTPSFIAPGDFNSDNKIDLAIVPNGGAKYISILYGDGAGAFSAPSNLALGDGRPTNLAVADFNGDGKADIVVARELKEAILILLGDGAGNFNLTASPVLENATLNSLLAPDLNRDGKPDLVGIGGARGENIAVLLNGCGATTASLSFDAPAYNVSETLNTRTFTVIRSGSLAGAVTVNYATSDNTAVSPSDYKATSGTLTFADGEASQTITVELVQDTLDEVTESFLITLSNPTGTAVLGGLNVLRVNIADDDPTLTYSVNNVTVNEGAGHVTITVTRTSEPTGVATLDYSTADTDSFTVGCADTLNNNGGAFARCDFATTVGRFTFAAGELSKTITVPLIDDGHDEGTETFQLRLMGVAGMGTALGAPSVSTVTILDNDEANAPNPIVTVSPSDYPFFVRQQYLDFLSREPESSEPWTAVMNRCPNVNTPPSAVTDCDRIAVSGAFFGSPEYRVKGLYVFRFYKVAFNRLPQYGEIVADMSFVAGATEAEVYARKAQLATAFVARQQFINVYGGLTNAQFVSALLSRYQLASIKTPDPAAPDGETKITFSAADLTNGLDAGTLTRVQVLRAIADSDQVGAAEYNSAFVAAQYYGYLRRTPEDSGYQAWLRVINEDPNNIRIMVNGFLNSTEYRLRFGKT